MARGDADLTRFNISLLDGAKASWQSSRNVLITNSGVFYRGAKRHAESAGDIELARSASARLVVAEILKEANETPGGSIASKASWEPHRVEVSRALEQMVVEKTLGRSEAEGVMSVLSK